MKKILKLELTKIADDLHDLKLTLRTYRFLFENYSSEGSSIEDQDDIRAIGHVLGKEVKRLESLVKKMEELAF